MRGATYTPGNLAATKTTGLQHKKKTTEYATELELEFFILLASDIHPLIHHDSIQILVGFDNQLFLPFDGMSLDFGGFE